MTVSSFTVVSSPKLFSAGLFQFTSSVEQKLFLLASFSQYNTDHVFFLFTGRAGMELKNVFGFFLPKMHYDAIFVYLLKQG